MAPLPNRCSVDHDTLALVRNITAYHPDVKVHCRVGQRTPDTYDIENKSQHPSSKDNPFRMLPYVASLWYAGPRARRPDLNTVPNLHALYVYMKLVGSIRCVGDENILSRGTWRKSFRIMRELSNIVHDETLRVHVCIYTCAIYIYVYTYVYVYVCTYIHVVF